MFYQITFLLVVASAYSSTVPTVPIVNVHCETFARYGCATVDLVDIHEPTVLNFVDSAKWNEALFFRIKPGSNVTVFPSGIFQQFPKLVDLSLTFALKSIAKDDFKNADALTELDIAYNQLQTLPANVFEYAKNLTKILAYRNQLTTIEDFAFNGLNYLDTLSLHNNSLIALKRNTFAGAPNISLLNLEHNQIESIEDGALNLPELKHIDLSYNRIESIGDGLLNLPKLEYILFSHNRIKTLADNVLGGAPILKMFAIEGNGLNHIGNAFHGCNELFFLILDDNPIEDLDFVALAKLPKLLRLGLKNSGFRWVDADQQHTESLLWELHLSNNGLTGSDALTRLRHFKNLVELQLGGNNLSELDGYENIKTDFPNLQEIGLSGNQFTCDKLKLIVDSIEAQKVAVSGRDTEAVGDEKNYNGVTCV